MKTIYETVYPWGVLDEVRAGHIVTAFDRADHHVEVVNEMTVEYLFAYLRVAEENPSRIEFWKEVEEDKENG